MENKYPYIGKSEITGDVVLLTSQGCGCFIECKDVGSIGRFTKKLHETYFKNITADYLRNTKIRVESPEHSAMIQKLVFGASGKWRSGRVITRSTDKYLFIDNDLEITESNIKHFFDRESQREIKLPMPPKEEKQESKSFSDKVDDALDAFEYFKVSLESKAPSWPKCQVDRDYEDDDEWPKVGDEVFFGVDHCDSGVVLCKHGDYLWIRTIDADAGSPMFVTKKTSSLKKPQAPLDTLSELLTPIVSENSRENSAYTAEQIARAILAGEIEDLEYKKPQ